MPDELGRARKWRDSSAESAYNIVMECLCIAQISIRSLGESKEDI